MGKVLEGRVAIITGASRGIGRALALRLAEEGADIVAASKSEAATDKLPGTIYETADAVRARGRRALAVKVDVRNEEDIAAMVDQTVAEFGRVDILINNAGALWWKPVLETPAKRFDLLMSINVRAAFLCSYYALPHMVRQKWGHIINMAPAIGTTPSPGMVAYMISKMSMARLAIGIAEEHRADNVAANALWPVTPIETAAVINNRLGERAQWRTPEIMCDAVMAILRQEPSACTGRQLTDEEILTEAGVTSFDRYWCEGQPPENPIYIDGRSGHGW
ncbi:MAG TPA: SDR family oxidoreductase [Symbiobacteriaceae bacterium]|nr:SDR family oxidoreductase [Symbiobacteriaceae bacterium]